MRMNGGYDYDEIKLYVPLLFPSGCDERILFYLFRKTKIFFFCAYSSILCSGSFIMNPFVMILFFEAL